MHLSMEELEAGRGNILQAPRNKGTLNLIVQRPETNQRKPLDVGELDLVKGLVGDNWLSRGNKRMEDGKADPEMQLNIMNSRVIALVAQRSDRFPTPKP